MTTRTRKPNRAKMLAGFHDRADRLRDDLRRDLLPLYEPDDRAGTQIGDLADGLADMIEAVRNVTDTAESLANCLKIERIIADGHTPPG